MTEQEMKEIRDRVRKELGEALGITFNENDQPQNLQNLSITEVRKLSNKMAKIKKDNKKKDNGGNNNYII